MLRFVCAQCFAAFSFEPIPSFFHSRAFWGCRAVLGWAGADARPYTIFANIQNLPLLRRRVASLRARQHALCLVVPYKCCGLEPSRPIAPAIYQSVISFLFVRGIRGKTHCPDCNIPALAKDAHHRDTRLPRSP